MARRVLLVETEKHSRKMFAQLLRQNGYEVLEAENGRGCVEHLFEQSVDLVVTNMIMPEMDGVQTIVAVRERFPEVKIMAVSANGMNSAEGCLKIAKALGAHKTLAKPLNPEKFLSEVKDCDQNHTMTPADTKVCLNASDHLQNQLFWRRSLLDGIVASISVTLHLSVSL